MERTRVRDQRVNQMGDAALTRLIAAFENTPGYLPREELCRQPGDDGGLATLLGLGLLKSSDEVVFDPLRITRGSLSEMRQKQVIAPMRQQVIDLLEGKPGKTAPRTDLVEQFGAGSLQMVLDRGGFTLFSVPSPRGDSVWVRLKGSDADTAKQIAFDAVQPKDEDWQAVLALCGDQVRHAAHDGVMARDQVIARSYTLVQAAPRLGVRKDTLQSAIGERLLPSFVDPEGVQRIPAGLGEAAREDADLGTQIAGLESTSTRELALVMGESGRAIEQKIRRAHINFSHKLRWRQIAGKWELPESLRDFRAPYGQRRPQQITVREQERVAARERRDEQRRAERERRDEERRQR